MFMKNPILKFYRKSVALFIFHFFDGAAAARFMGVNVGNNTRIYIKDFGTEPFLISIGSCSTITSGVKILTHDGALSLVKDSKGRRFSYAQVCIGSNVFIGVNSIILPGCSVGDNVIVAAGSVVTKPIQSGLVVAGNPAKPIARFDDWVDRKLCYPSAEDINSESCYVERIKKCIDLQKRSLQ